MNSNQQKEAADIILVAYLNMEKLSATVPDLHKYLNANGYCGHTVCPECGIDDFVHVEGCELQKVNNL